MPWLPLCLIALGGALGALTRYGVGVWVTGQVPHSAFPWATFVINVSGSLVIGFAATYLEARSLWRPLLTVGFVGAYTTFSTFEYETARLQSSWQALLNVTGSVIAGYAAVWLGIRLAHALLGVRHG